MVTYNKAMKLSAMLQLQKDSVHPLCLPLNFGDSYLMQNNQIFRNVRIKTCGLGFSFSDKPDANYLSFPMGQLENILKRKIIPYTDNVTALESLNRQASNLEWDHIADNL